MEKQKQELLHLAQSGNEEAKERVVKENMGLVYSLIARFHSNLAYDDLVQIGCLGLVKAINNFDFSFDVEFSTYAVPIILGEVKRYFRDEGQMKVSRSIKENAIKLRNFQEKFTQENQREATFLELQEGSGLDSFELTLALESSSMLTSLDKDLDTEDMSERSFYEIIKDQHQIDIHLSIALKKEIKNLKMREQLLLYYRYQKEYNQSQIAKRLNCSQVQISRMEKKIYAKLREKLLAENKEIKVK